MKRNKSLSSNRAITLVALIITIIVMLILVAVTVRVVVNSDIIGQAEEAKGMYQNAYATETVDDETIIGGKYATIDEYLEKNGHDVKMLEGNEQEYYTLAPSALSFRSSADIGDFQEVQINGETINPSNYTITEGSTIINLSIDYLKTLEQGEYSVSIVSKTGSPSAKFSVVKPDLNEHGFYYGQPYYAYLENSGTGYAFMMHENGMASIYTISIAMGSMECPYTVDDNIITLHTPEGDIIGNLSSDNKSIYCAYIDATLTLSNRELVADEEYLYCYSEDYGGYEARAIDKSKQYYKPIKSNIYGIDVVSLRGAFCDCVNMLEAPEIPKCVTILENTYQDCKALTIAPKIPEGVTGMLGTFVGCTSLTTAPVIPSNVIDLSSTFARCYKLTGTIEINTSKLGTELDNSNIDCFFDTKLPIKIVGSCSKEIKAILSSTAENGNVTY